MDLVPFETIARVDPEEWDVLAGEHVTASHGWLRLVEETSLGAGECHGILVRENSQLLASMFFWQQTGAGMQHDLDASLFGSLAPLADTLGFTTLPALIGSNRAGSRQTILFRDGMPGDKRERLLALMLEFLENTPLGKDRTICFCGIPVHDREISKVFSSRGYFRSPEWPTCYMDIRWNSFADYLRALRQEHPRTEKNIHRELSHARRAGIRFERLNEPAARSRHLHALINVNYLRLNRRPLPFGHEFFEQIKARMGDRVVISTAVHNGHIIGVQVRLRNKESIMLSMIGIDADYFHRHSVYFNLGYNQVIRDAIEEGFRRIGFGTRVYDTKIRRGCLLLDTNMYVRPRTGARGLLLRCLAPLRALRMRQLRPSFPRST